METVQVPSEFLGFVAAFRNERPECVTDISEWIGSALRHLDADSQRALKQFLTDLLGRIHDEADLQRMWSSTKSNYYVVGKEGDGGMRTFLTMIRDQIV